MKLAVIIYPANDYNYELSEQIAEQNLIGYASEAADEMEFESMEELQEAVKRAMAVCLAKGMTLKNNFKRIFKSSPFGLVYDWKLSIIAYELVKLNGNPANPKIAERQISLLKGNR